VERKAEYDIENRTDRRTPALNRGFNEGRRSVPRPDLFAYRSAAFRFGGDTADVGEVRTLGTGPEWRNGIRSRLKIGRPQGHEGSTPSSGTTQTMLRMRES
jgi:hypothetical protein